MATNRDRLVQDAAARGKYAPLYRHLVGMLETDWRVSFAELEAILGFGLPASARLYRPWWSNQKRGAGHSHALAWHAAGWKTRAVNLDEESLTFERADGSLDRAEAPPVKNRFDLDKDWPAIPGGSWSPGFTVGREQIYDESGRLTGGPQDEPGRRETGCS